LTIFSKDVTIGKCSTMPLICHKVFLILIVHPRLIEVCIRVLLNGTKSICSNGWCNEFTRKDRMEKTEALYTTKYDPETEITITSGATQAIYTAIASIINEAMRYLIFYTCI